MILKVFKTKPEPEPKKEVCLRLVKDIDGVKLIACDENGERLKSGSLLTIRTDGYIQLHTEFNKGLGLQLDETGKIKIG